ncbi:MAG: sodium:proton antiporter [Clostridia bacterium]|nr:sodium:proton antiporter [Clostridia bacterium]
MAFIQNVPFFSIILSMISGIFSSALKRKAARSVTIVLSAVVLAMNIMLTVFMLQTGESYTYMMGHYPAPFGNEIRAGLLESVMASVFALILLMSLLGGLNKIDEQIQEQKQNLYFIMADLMLASLLALVYTNDLFTAYVFIEINTIAAAALIMSRQNGHCLAAATRYMIMNLLASGLLLMGITMLYGITGHLLMSNIRESVANLFATGEYHTSLTVVVVLITVALCIKSALFPFQEWLPDAYGYSTPSSAAMLSSLISKSYIFLLIKIFYRVIGMEVVVSTGMTNILFLFGIIGMILGSVSAIRERDIRRMVAFSSVAQIGYIYMGLGLGTREGVIAAIFHMIIHAAAKSMLFLSASGLIDVSGDIKQFRPLRGSGYRHKAAGAAFTVGALSMVGVPLFGGFLSKVYFASSALDFGGIRAVIVLAALAVSTLLNTMYFLHTVISIYRPATQEVPAYNAPSKLSSAALWVMAAVNVALGTLSVPLYQAIARGLDMFS